jgi:ubiquinone/menaquinone biosynthesis C-methylase UbiE
MSMSQESDAARFFDSFADAFDSIYDGKRNFLMRSVDRHLRSDMFIRFALTFEAFGDLNGKTVLDIGCGSGPYVVEALHRGADRVTAVDPAPRMLDLVRNRLKTTTAAERCSLVEGSFPTVDVAAHDHVIVMGVLDYVGDSRAFLAALKAVTRVSAAVSFPSRHWLRAPLRRFRYRLRKCPLYLYDETTIKQVSSAAGFGNVHIRKIPGAGMDYHVCLKP